MSKAARLAILAGAAEQYFTAYEVGARGKGAADSGTYHLGFGCGKSKATSGN
jgi:hypothetical protein